MPRITTFNPIPVNNSAANSLWASSAAQLGQALQGIAHAVNYFEDKRAAQRTGELNQWINSHDPNSVNYLQQLQAQKDSLAGFGGFQEDTIAKAMEGRQLDVANIAHTDAGTENVRANTTQTYQKIHELNDYNNAVKHARYLAGKVITGTATPREAAKYSRIMNVNGLGAALGLQTVNNASSNQNQRDLLQLNTLKSAFDIANSGLGVRGGNSSKSSNTASSNAVGNSQYPLYLQSQAQANPADIEATRKPFHVYDDGITAMTVAHESNVGKYKNNWYDATNVWTGKKDAKGRNIYKYTDYKVSNMKVADIMELQSQHKILAAGAFQMIPPTLADAVKKGYLDPNETFTPEVQERVYVDYLLNDKKGQLNKYLDGTGSLEAAYKDINSEWAYAPKWDGHSRYEEQGNHAGVTPNELVSALQKTKAKYQTLISNGVSKEQARVIALLGQERAQVYFQGKQQAEEKSQQAVNNLMAQLTKSLNFLNPNTTTPKSVQVPFKNPEQPQTVQEPQMSALEQAAQEQYRQQQIEDHAKKLVQAAQFANSTFLGGLVDAVKDQGNTNREQAAQTLQQALNNVPQDQREQVLTGLESSSNTSAFKNAMETLVNAGREAKEAFANGMSLDDYRIKKARDAENTDTTNETTYGTLLGFLPSKSPSNLHDAISNLSKAKDTNQEAKIHLDTTPEVKQEDIISYPDRIDLGNSDKQTKQTFNIKLPGKPKPFKVKALSDSLIRSHGSELAGIFNRAFRYNNNARYSEVLSALVSKSNIGSNNSLGLPTAKDIVNNPEFYEPIMSKFDSRLLSSLPEKEATKVTNTLIDNNYKYLSLKKRYSQGLIKGGKELNEIINDTVAEIQGTHNTDYVPQLKKYLISSFNNVYKNEDGIRKTSAANAVANLAFTRDEWISLIERLAPVFTSSQSTANAKNEATTSIIKQFAKDIERKHQQDLQDIKDDTILKINAILAKSNFIK